MLEGAGTSVVAVRLFAVLPRHPVVSVASVIERLAVSKSTVVRAVEALEKVGVLVETTGKRRDRSWIYQRYLDRLRVGAELETTDRQGERA
jgi:DNA-binding MarR family transcriptional regulator